jgi:hypothetical protein
MVGPFAAAIALGAGIGALAGHTDEYIFRFLPGDTLDVTAEEILEVQATSFIGRIGDRKYRFDKAEATYSWKTTPTGVNVTVRGTRGMFLRMGVLSTR